MNKFRFCAFADEASKSLDGQISALLENGMDLLEMRGVDGKNVADLTLDEARAAARKLSDAGIRVWSIGSPIGKVDISEPPQKELDRFMRILETATLTGAENVRLFSFYGCTDADEDAVLSRLGEFLRRAEGSGVRLCHENEKGIFGDTAARCEKLFAALPSLGGIFDPANYVQCGEDTLAAWDRVGKFTAYAHIKDARTDGKVVPPGEGEGHLPELLRLFGKQGVEVLTLEPHLKVFPGLSALEQGTPDVGGIRRFATGRDAFDFAAGALRALTEKL